MPLVKAPRSREPFSQSSWALSNVAGVLVGKRAVGGILAGHSLLAMTPIFICLLCHVKGDAGLTWLSRGVRQSWA